MVASLGPASMIIVVLPAFNEAKNLEPLMAAMQKAMHDADLGEHRIIVVDDGSTDDTVPVVERLARSQPIELLRNPKNLGLAQTLKNGLVRAVELASDEDIIVTMDADNSHTPGLIEKMVQGIREGNDLVIASRYRYGATTRGLATSRKLLSIGASALFQLMFPIEGVRDYTCGYRAYRGALLRRAFREIGPDQLISERGFSCMVDILLKISELDPICVEVPLILRYDQKQGPSKMKVASTVADTLKLIARRKLAAITKH